MKKPGASRTVRSVVQLSGIWAGLYAAESSAVPTPNHTGAGSKLSVACPQSETDEPRFRNNKTGKTFRIADPRLRAVAAKACEAEPGLGDAGGNVDLVNQRPEPVFVSFTLSDHSPGPIQWGANCTPAGAGVRIGPGETCAATVAPSTSSRFCASLDQTPADCFDAQTHHQTMVETIFQSASAPGCFNKGNCVWYDISVIPSNCTDDLWKQDQCAGTGGASYNLPVTLACGGSATFTCQGPSDTTYGPENYPKNCGNPNATCVGNSANCVNAYFYPMFYPPENKYGPNVPCLSGQTLIITFLPGP